MKILLNTNWTKVGFGMGQIRGCVKIFEMIRDIGQYPSLHSLTILTIIWMTNNNDGYVKIPDVNASLS